MWPTATSLHVVFAVGMNQTWSSPSWSSQTDWCCEADVGRGEGITVCLVLLPEMEGVTREGFLEEAGYRKVKIGGVDGSALTLFSTVSVY